MSQPDPKETPAATPTHALAVESPTPAEPETDQPAPVIKPTGGREDEQKLD